MQPRNSFFSDDELKHVEALVGEDLAPEIVEIASSVQPEELNDHSLALHISTMILGLHTSPEELNSGVRVVEALLSGSIKPDTPNATGEFGVYFEELWAKKLLIAFIGRVANEVSEDG